MKKIFSGGRTSFIYEYDLGDSWRHKVKLLDTLEGKESEKPLCTAGARACPPEDRGGPPGFDEMLKALPDPDKEEHNSMWEWVGGKFDTDAFDVATVDRTLKRLR